MKGRNGRCEEMALFAMPACLLLREAPVWFWPGSYHPAALIDPRSARR